MDIGLLLERATGDAPMPVSVTVDDVASCRELAAALARFAGVTGSPSCVVARTGTDLAAGGAVGSLELRHGDVLRIGAARRSDEGGGRHEPAPRPDFHLMVVGGPMAGARFPLGPGEHVVGRDPRADVTLRDDAASRRHLLLVVGDDGVEIADLGSSNGSFVDGRALTGRRRLEPGQVVGVGGTLLAVEPAAGPANRDHPYAGGRLLFNRPPRVTRPFSPPAIALPAAPVRPEKAKLPMGAAVVPIIMGLAMFVLLQNTTFLLFMALGPAMAVFTVLDNRRSGRSTFRRQVAAFDKELASVADRIGAARQEVVVERRRAHPSAAHLAARAIGLTADLWERRPGDSDFLSLRVGTADLATRLEIEVVPGGDPDIRKRAEEIEAEHALDADVPVAVELRGLGAVGVVGDHRHAESVARWLVLQAAVLHSPRDLAVVVLVPAGAAHRWEWARWLPHAETISAHGGGPSVATGPEECRALFAAVEAIAARRRAARSRVGLVDARPAPEILVVLAGATGVEPAAVSKLLDDCRSLGICGVVMADAADELPGECQAVVESGSRPDDVRLTETATGEVIRQVVGDVVDLGTAAEVARALAPLRDTGAGDAGGLLPAAVSFVDLPGVGRPDTAAIRRSWARSTRPVAVIGMGRAGPVALDLRTDGPHALVAGTTGSGKSEFLQTLVASLALTSPPDRLAFVLVDYKGGAAFKDCIGLPHTVGFVTDLDAHLAERALVSLNAEVRRREAVLKAGGAKDLVELEARGVPGTPPSLVIVVDEFAFLKKEVPEFVAGAVDLAQRGRSLGIHLVLATQRPTGVVDDNIRANTNLRVALRVNDEHESTDVVGRPDAAHVPRTIPGRAFIRTGHAEVQEVQTGYVGGSGTAGAASHRVVVRPFTFAMSPPPEAPVGPAPSGDGGTDLQRLVAAVRQAAAEAGLDRTPSPWLAPLASRYRLDELDPGPSAGALAAVLGVVDEPEHQRQLPLAVDLADTGHLLVYGASGSGKTTLLRTVAASLAGRFGTDQVVLYGLDFASQGLRAISGLPHCAGVVPGHDGELVERLFATIDVVIAERKELLGRHGAGSLAELRRQVPGTGQPPHVVVLLDDYGGFAAAFEEVDHGALIDRLARQVSDGRAVGVHFVITASRRSGLPTALTAQIAQTIVLRLADADEYSWLGLTDRARGASLPSGRGFLGAGPEVQVAVVGDDPSGDGQAAALAELGHRLTDAGHHPVPRLGPVPTQVLRSDLPPPAGDARALVPIGIDGTTLAPVGVDLADLPTFLVAGPDRSGRSTALATLVAGFHAAGGPGIEAFLLAPRRSVLTGGGEWSDVASGLDACEAMAARLVDLLRARSEDTDAEPMLLVVDDGDELTTGPVASSLEVVVRKGRDAGVVLLVATQSHVLHRTFGGWLPEVRKSKHGLLLGPDTDIDGDLLGVRLPRKANRTFPPGRGYLAVRGTALYLQVAR